MNHFLMRIPLVKHVELPPAHRRYRHDTPQCEKVGPYCTKPNALGLRVGKCSRFAALSVDGKHYCHQHAGEALLVMVAAKQSQLGAYIYQHWNEIRYTDSLIEPLRQQFEKEAAVMLNRVKWSPSLRMYGALEEQDLELARHYTSMWLGFFYYHRMVISSYRGDQ